MQRIYKRIRASDERKSFSSGEHYVDNIKIRNDYHLENLIKSTRRNKNFYLSKDCFYKCAFYDGMLSRLNAEAKKRNLVV